MRVIYDSELCSSKYDSLLRIRVTRQSCYCFTQQALLDRKRAQIHQGQSVLPGLVLSGKGSKPFFHQPFFNSICWITRWNCKVSSGSNSWKFTAYNEIPDIAIARFHQLCYIEVPLYRNSHVQRRDEIESKLVSCLPSPLLFQLRIEK